MSIKNILSQRVLSSLGTFGTSLGQRFFWPFGLLLTSGELRVGKSCASLCPPLGFPLLKIRLQLHNPDDYPEPDEFKLAERSLFAITANILAAFDITAPRDADGNPVYPEVKMGSGVLLYVLVLLSRWRK